MAKKAGPMALTLAGFVLVGLTAFFAGVMGFGALMGFEAGNRFIESFEEKD